MLIAEYDYDMDIEVQREEAFVEGKAAGLVEGEVQERILLNNLTMLLLKDGRETDLKKALEDTEYQDELIKEYGLTKNL